MSQGLLDATPVSNDPAILERRQSQVADTVQGQQAKEQGVLEQSPTTSSEEEEKFKEGGYGWVVVVCVSLINAHTWGLNSSYAVFLAYYLRSGTIGTTSPLAFAFVGGLSISIAFVISPIVTTVVRVFDTRTALLLGVFFQTVAFIGASFTREIWQLLLSQGVAFGLGMGFCFVGTAGVVPQWFKKRRSLATAISASGSGFGGLAYSLATNAMITRIGLPWAFRVLAIISFVIDGTCSLLIRDRNHSVGAVLVTFRKDLFQRVEYWLFMAWGFFSLAGYIIVNFSMADYAQDAGFTAQQGSILVAMFNLSQGLGRPLIGYISDPLGRLNVAAAGTLYAALAAFFLWIFAGQYLVGCIIYAFMGAFAGLMWATIAPIGAEIFGLSMLPSALSATWLFFIGPATCAEAIALSLKRPNTTGAAKYIDVQIFAGVMFVAGFVCLWLLRSWKIDELEQMRLTKEQRRMEIRDDDAVPATARGEGGVPGRSGVMPFVKHLFTVTAV